MAIKEVYCSGSSRKIIWSLYGDVKIIASEKNQSESEHLFISPPLVAANDNKKSERAPSGDSGEGDSNLHG